MGENKDLVISEEGTVGLTHPSYTHSPPLSGPQWNVGSLCRSHLAPPAATGPEEEADVK